MKSLVNHVLFVIDESQSMSHLVNKVPQVFDRLISELKNSGQETRISFVRLPNKASRFSYGSYNQAVVDSNIVNVKASLVNNSLTYNPTGGHTPLYDAVGLGIETLSSVKLNNRKNNAFLVIVLTDGEENSSKQYSQYTIKNLIAEKTNLGNWTFVFQVPPGKRYKAANDFGVSSENIIEWDLTEQGLEASTVETQTGLMNYCNSRATGKSAVTSFYTDLSNVTKKQLTNNLDDVSLKYKSYLVSSEGKIKDFVETKTKKPYVQGTAFYQLMKKEEIQPQKALLIMDKRTKELWGGQQARNIIGLPHYESAKVTPGNHGDYEIFVQSTSVNRKLSRGTKVLVQKVI